MRTDLEGRLPIVYNGRTAEEWHTLYCQATAKHQIEPTDEIENRYDVVIRCDSEDSARRQVKWLEYYSIDAEIVERGANK